VRARSASPTTPSSTGAPRPTKARAAKTAKASTASDVAGEPASRRALRSQGRKTMRKLLDAAMIVFARRGYYAARVDDIVKVARTSHGTFYLYFSNKEDLLRALVAEAGEVVSTLDTSLGHVGPDDQGWRELRRWMEQFSDAWQRYAPVLRAWTDLAMSDEELSAQGHQAAGAVALTLASRIAECGPQRGVEPGTAAVAVVAMVERFHYLRQFAGEPVDADALDTLTTMVHRGLFGGGTPPAGSLVDGAGPGVTPKKAGRADGAGRKKA
jgi:AcrR family transcriptional regulator